MEQRQHIADRHADLIDGGSSGKTYGGNGVNLEVAGPDGPDWKHVDLFLALLVNNDLGVD